MMKRKWQQEEEIMWIIMLLSSTYSALKFRSDQPKATCRLDRHPSLILHHCKTVAIRPAEADLATVGKATRNMTCYEINTFFCWCFSLPACVIG